MIRDNYFPDNKEFKELKMEFCGFKSRAIFEDNKDNTKKMNNLKVICNELIKYGIKNESIPMIKFVNHGEKTTIFTLEDYLKSKGINLEDLSIGKDCNKESIDISR